MTVQQFLAGIQSIVDDKPVYALGGSAQKPRATSSSDYDKFGAFGCDCIGLIIGAIRRQGGIWTGTHGSNWAARNAMQYLNKYPFIIEAGTVVYKASEPGSASYALPAAYIGHADQRDYYHVGVVTQVSPLRITHCTSWTGGSGIKVDTVPGKWLYGGRLKAVEYDGGGGGNMPIETAVIRVDGTARLRTLPNKTALILANVRDGSVVDVLDKQDGWWRVSSGGKLGWMMSQYLTPTPTEPPPGDTAPDEVTLKLDRKVVAALKQALDKVV